MKQTAMPTSQSQHDETLARHALTASPDARRLTSAEIDQFHRDGYIKNLPVFAPDAVQTLQKNFAAMAALLPPDINVSLVNNWHKAHTFSWALIHNQTIADYVEDLIGPNIMVWGNQFFVKYPNDGSIVPFHQDAQYWPLSPKRTITAWIAVHDADEGNGAMQVVKGSHREGEFAHHVNDDPRYALEQEVADDDIDQERIVSLDLKAGEISLHDDGLLHGSPPNNDPKRVRCGMTIRYIPTDVVCDLAVWPTFETVLIRGVNPAPRNPIATMPTVDQYPVRKFQHSSEFE